MSNSRGVVAQHALDTCLPTIPLTSGHANDLGCAECVEAVHEGDADVDFGGLAVGVSCGDAFAECLEAAHFGLDAAAGVVAGPAFPERTTEVAGRAEGLVADPGGGAVFLPGAAALTDRDDRRSLARDDGGVTAAGVVGSIGGHGGDFFVLRDLVEQLGQEGAVNTAIRITVAARARSA